MVDEASGDQTVSEDQYKADLELLDRYVGFSAELVRVSLLGLTALGFYLKEFVANSGRTSGSLPPTLSPAWFNELFGIAALLFGMTVACGLLHRYYAIDGLACHIKALRLAGAGNRSGELDKEILDRQRRYRLSNGWLVSSECAVAAGAGIAGLAFGIRFLIAPEQQSCFARASAIILVFLASVVAGIRWWRILQRRLIRAQGSGQSGS